MRTYKALEVSRQRPTSTVSLPLAPGPKQIPALVDSGLCFISGYFLLPGLWDDCLAVWNAEGVQECKGNSTFSAITCSREALSDRQVDK